jgi:hypothetical protein
MNQSTCRHHFGIKHGMLRDKTMKKSAMPISPIYHRSHTEPMWCKAAILLDIALHIYVKNLIF